MRGYFSAAACLVPLLLASPVSAQSRAALRAPGLGPDRTRDYVAPDTRTDQTRLFEEPSVKRRGNRLIGAWSGAESIELGVGLYRIPKVNFSDPNRNHPMRDPTGKTMGVAAVGMKFRF